MIKKIILFFVITIILFNTALASENNPEITSAPLNPEFVDYQSNMQKSDENTIMTSSANTPSYSLGLVPSPVDLSHLQPKKPGSNRLFTAQSLPDSYDLRENNSVTPVRDQGETGSCWTFATYASLESCTYDEGPYDFSENHMKNILSNESPTGFDSEQGGNMLMATAYLARWSGPVNETDDPYSDNSSYNDYTNPDKPVTKHIQEVLYLPTRANFTDEEYQVSDDAYLKEAVMEYGAVFSYFMVNMSAFDDTYTTYYYNESVYDGGHAVALVGWNDSYPKENFKITPPGDGAFILKNSWGTGVGDEGYFYISYYEKSFNDHPGHPAVLNATEDADNYDNIYQYDPLGYTDSRGFSNSTTVHGANVFQSSSEEYLEAVSFYTTDTNAVYNVSIYTNLSSSTPVGQTLLAQTNGIFAHAGYHTLTLDTPVNLAEGQKFSVTNKISNPEYEYPLATEYPESSYSSRASANPNESFMSFDGSNWTDVGKLNNTSICIKAFTSAPPSTVSNLTAVVGPSWINWTWSNPDEKDFNHTEVYINNTLISTTSGTYYNLTGLLDGTNHSIGLKSVDTDGYVNSTRINNTSQTVDIVPGSTTDLHIKSSTSGSITWGWTNPANHDFDHVEVYLDGVFQANTSGSSYRVADLRSGSDYEIGLKTVDRAGNINNTVIIDVAPTKRKPSGNVVKGMTKSRESRENIV
jgi:C1A family cysteine protease